MKDERYSLKILPVIQDCSVVTPILNEDRSEVVDLHFNPIVGWRYYYEIDDDDIDNGYVMPITLDSVGSRENYAIFYTKTQRWVMQEDCWGHGYDSVRERFSERLKK